MLFSGGRMLLVAMTWYIEPLALSIARPRPQRKPNSMKGCLHKKTRRRRHRVRRWRRRLPIRRFLASGAYAT